MFATSQLAVDKYANIIQPRPETTRRPLHPDDLLNGLDRQTLVSFAFVPYVAAEIAWDYADTCINLATVMRLKATKPLCRRVRELRNSYQQHRCRFIDERHQDAETDTMIAFQEANKDYFAKLRINIQTLVERDHPGLNADSLTLLCSAYTCAVVLKATVRYMDIVEAKVVKTLGRELGGSPIAKEIKELSKIILQFAGEDSIGGNNEFPRMLKVFVEALVNYLLALEIIEID